MLKYPDAAKGVGRIFVSEIMALWIAVSALVLLIAALVVLAFEDISEEIIIRWIRTGESIHLTPALIVLIVAGSTLIISAIAAVVLLVSGLTTFKGNRPHLSDAVVAKNYLDEKELRSLGQIVSGYLDFAERQAEREEVMTMKDWAKHLDRILTMSGEQLLIGAGNVSHTQAVNKATEEYKKYQSRTLSEVEKDYLDTIKAIEDKAEKGK